MPKYQNCNGLKYSIIHKITQYAEDWADETQGQFGKNEGVFWCAWLKLHNKIKFSYFAYTWRKNTITNKLYVYDLKWLFTLAAHIKLPGFISIKLLHLLNSFFHVFIFPFYWYFLHFNCKLEIKTNKTKKHSEQPVFFRFPTNLFLFRFPLTLALVSRYILCACIFDFYFYESDFSIETNRRLSEISISIPNTILISASILRLFCYHHLFWFYFIYFYSLQKYKLRERKKMHIWH